MVLTFPPLYLRRSTWSRHVILCEITIIRTSHEAYRAPSSRLNGHHVLEETTADRFTYYSSQLLSFDKNVPTIPFALFIFSLYSG